MENQLELTEAEQKAINKIKVNDPVTCNSATRVCYPEDVFDVIQQCKSCGRCV